MFISIIYALYASTAGYPLDPWDEVRVLSKPLYGKHMAPGEAPHAFFIHYYGSSWHSDDAGFVAFLGTYGILVLYVGVAILVFGAGRLLFAKLRAVQHGLCHTPPGTRRSRLGRYYPVTRRILVDQITGRHQSGSERIAMSPTSSHSSADISPPPSPQLSPYSEENSGSFVEEEDGSMFSSPVQARSWAQKAVGLLAPFRQSRGRPVESLTQTPLPLSHPKSTFSG